MEDAKEPKSVVVTWPLAWVLICLSVCLTVLALGGILTREMVIGGIGMLVGIAVPTQPLATRWRTVYSKYPPPMTIESDKPPPPEKP